MIGECDFAVLKSKRALEGVAVAPPCWQFGEVFPANYAAEDPLPRGGMPTQSTVRFKAPGSASSMQRVESNVVPKSKSKVQIPRVASTSPKGPNLLKKRLKKNQKDAKVVARSAAPRTPCSPAHVEHLGPVLDNEVTICSLQQKVAGGKANTHLSDDESKPSREASPDKAGRRQNSAVFESPVSCTNPAAQHPVKRKCKSSSGRKVRGADVAAEALETSAVKMITKCKTSPRSDSSLDALLSCISNILKKDEGFYDLQITPVRTGGGEFSLESDFQTLVTSSASQDVQITEVVTAFENYDDFNSPETDTIYLSPTASITPQELNDGGDCGFANEDSIAKMLIGEIDLHLELENYLREIESFNGARNRTKNTLQSNLCEDYCFNDSSLSLQNRTNEFFELTEIKSNSSFASATSTCTQQDGDTNKLHVFLDRKHDMVSVSEEHFDPRNTKVFISQTQFTDKVGDIRKIKSDNEPKKIQQEAKLKSSIKRTFGKTSFQSSRAEEEEEKGWVPPPLQSDPSTGSSVDSYEKILPFGSHSNKTCDQAKKLSSLLSTKSADSLSSESFPKAVRKSVSDSDRYQEWTEQEENAGSDELSEPEELSSENPTSGALPKLEPKRRLWSPSLQELIEIYNNVLKQNKKIRSNSRTSVSRCISSHLFAFLNKELQEKECKAKLLMLSKDLNKKLKTPQVWKPGRQKNGSTLEEYVTMFQEILKSSLSIGQIARLNNIISGLQEYSEKNYDMMKNLKGKGKEDVLMKAGKMVRVRSASERKVAPEKTSLLLTPPKREFPAEKEIGTPRQTPRRCQVRRKKTQDAKPEAEDPILVEEVTKIELTSPTELESILQSCFAAEEIEGARPRDANDKILVTVKLRGNQVFVSKLSYFKNERALSPGRVNESGTSQLIIENVTKDRVKEVSRKSTKKVKPREVYKRVEPEKPKSETRGKAEPKKVKKHAKVVKTAPAARKDRRTERDDKSFLPKEFKEPKLVQDFEYDQMQLRAQHPIEAIIESSESRISEHVESSEDDQTHLQLEPPPEKKILLTDIHNKVTMKEALMEALVENVHSKDLGCDFRWSDEKILDKKLSRTRSYVINRETLKKQTTAQKPPKHAETVRSLSDLTKKPKCKRKGRRKATSYMCYPSILNLQRKPAAAKKKSKKQFRQNNRSVCASNSRVHLNCGPNPQQQGVARGSSKEFSSRTPEPDLETPKMSASTTVQKDLDNVTMSSMDTAASGSDEVVLDCCSMELLYYDSENLSASVTPKMSASVVKPASKTASAEHVPLPLEGKGPKCGRPSALPVEGIKGSPIVIHPPRNDSDDTIFHSVMIHSDSFLKKCYSSLALTQANLNSFLKFSSDMKFYPGRVSSSDRHQNPFVKFVLTPSQNADAGLPSNQVQVVDKKLAAEDAVVEFFKREGAQSTSKEIDEKIPLSSIEKFIKRLSKGKNKEKAKPKVPGKGKPEGSKETPPNLKPGQKKKGSVPDQQSRSKATDRKPYHECQKRRLNDRAKGAEKKAKAPDSKTKLNKEKPPLEPPQENSEISLISLKKFILTLSQIMESYEQFTNGTTKNKGEQGEGAGATVADVDLLTERMSTEGHVEKGTNTTPQTKCSLTRVPDCGSDIPEQGVQLVKSALTQTDDVPYVKDGAEGEFEEEAEKPKGSDNGTLPREATPPRKLKTLKIRIHCDERGNCKDGGKEGKTGQKEARNPVPGKGNPQRLMEQMGLLDSLVMGEPKGGTLERRNSIYFDATDLGSDEESETVRAEGRVDDSQQEFLTHWATVEPVELSGLVGKDKSEGSPPSPRSGPNSSTPEGSAECLFDEILKSLQDDKICDSLALLDEFLEKAEFSASWSGNSERLRNVLLLVSNRTKNLMIGMEKSAWLKVLSLLEDISQKLGSEDRDFRGCQTGFAEKLRRLNDSRLVDLQKFCSSLSQTAIRDNSRAKNVFSRIKDSLNYLRSRISVQRSHSENSIRSTAYLAETPGAAERPIDQPEKNPLQQLRKQIQRQKTYIEFLLSADCSVLPQEIQDVKGKVVEKMKTFGDMFSTMSEGRNVGEPQRDHAPHGAEPPSC